MIILDFNGIAMSAFHSQKNVVVEEGMLRHLILNTIRTYNVKFRNKYGEMVVAVDSRSWRKDYYEYYKANRKKSRDESDVDWTEVFRVFSLVVDEIKENLPWVTLKVDNTEADDIIAVLCQDYREPIMIVSNDKDLNQLQRYPNVKQFSPMKSKEISVKDPETYLKEHILTGDAGDGVPNVLSPDDVLVTEGVRQKPLTGKRKSAWIDNWDDLRNNMTELEYRNFQRNEKMIDLEKIPEDIKQRIRDAYNGYERINNKKVMNYLISKRCRNLISSSSEFFTKKAEAKKEVGLTSFM